MIVNISAHVVCDQCSEEVPCKLPIEFGWEHVVYVVKRPEGMRGLVITERYGHGPEQKYLCDKCASDRGYEKCPKCGKYKDQCYNGYESCIECRVGRA